MNCLFRYVLEPLQMASYGYLIIKSLLYYRILWTKDHLRNKSLDYGFTASLRQLALLKPTLYT